MATAKTGKPEDKGDTPLANMSMEEFMEEISKRYSLIPKEDVPQAQPRTKLEKLLQGMTPNKTADKLFNSGVHATSTPVTTAQYNMPVSKPTTCHSSCSTSTVQHDGLLTAATTTAII